MSIKKIYSDSTLRGDVFLQPFKKSAKTFGYTFQPWSIHSKSFCHKVLDCLKRICCFAAGLFGAILTTPLVPVGMLVKYSLQSKQPKSDPNEEDPLETNLDRPAGTTSSSSSSSLSRTGASAGARNFEAIEIVHPYPGDLQANQKRAIDTNFLDSHTLSLQFKTAPDFAVTIRNQNIFQSGAHVIVNAANTPLDCGGGIDGAIHAKGGNAYATAHRKLKTHYQSNYTSGYAAMINSGNLKNAHGIDQVIVVAGPAGASTPQKENQLYSCYYNSLLLAHQEGKTSLALPSISTGIFGFPKNRAAEISTRAIYSFINEYPASKLKTISIHFLKDVDLNDYKSALS